MRWLVILLCVACQPAVRQVRVAEAPKREACECRNPPDVERTDGGGLSGPWEQTGQLVPGPVVRCADGYRTLNPDRSTVRAWTLRQRGDHVQLWASTSTVSRTGNLLTESRRCEEVRGGFDGGVLILEGTECSLGPSDTRVYEGMPSRRLSPEPQAHATKVTWSLALDEGTGHLVGTRNTSTVRLAPVKFVKSGPACFDE
ncbi:MAG: hypothetical protein Q8L48_28510 [Archangium sp.]|nr:hypothetical protein [Archangium sp.]